MHKICLVFFIIIVYMYLFDVTVLSSVFVTCKHTYTVICKLYSALQSQSCMLSDILLTRSCVSFCSSERVKSGVDEKVRQVTCLIRYFFLRHLLPKCFLMFRKILSDNSDFCTESVNVSNLTVDMAIAFIRKIRR